MPFPVGNHPGGGPVIEQVVFRDAWQDGETITYPITNSAAASTYEVRNYYGMIVAAGSVTGSSVTLPSLPLGWYKLYVTKTTTDAAPWNNYGDERCFCIVRTDADSPMTDRPSVTISETTAYGDAANDLPARGFFGVGPARHKFWDSNTQPPASNTAQTGILNEIPYFVSNRVADSARPQKPLVAVPEVYDPANATHQAVIGAAVTAAGNANGEVWWEGLNEPNVVQNPATYAPIQKGFADVVHAAHASAKVIGPSSLNIVGVLDNQGTGLGWMYEFLQISGVASRLDGISFHNYNAQWGDLASLRRDFDKFLSMLTSLGLQGKPRWNTEFGSTWAAVAGSFEPRLQAKNIMMELHVHEQYGIPKEQVFLFYDCNMGFWSYPAFWLMKESGKPQPTATAPLMRVWAEELFGKNYSAKLDFGSENGVWIGSRFTGGDGSSVVALQSSGHVGNVTLSVSGTSSIVTVNPWGALTTRPVVGGVVSMPVDELVSYVRCPAGITATPVALNYGVDSTRNPNSTYAATNQNALAPLAFDTDDTYASGDWLADAGSLPATLTGTFKTPGQRFNRVYLTGPSPHNPTCAITKATIQALSGGVWTTIFTINEPTTYKVWTSGNAAGGCYIDSFSSRRSQWVFRSDTAITADAVRLVVTETTYGGSPTNESFQGNPNVGGEIGQGGPPRPQVRLFQVTLNEYDLAGKSTPNAPLVAIA